jgi:hypothetical protein
MYLLEKHIHYECCCIKIGSKIESSYKYRVLERKLLKSFIEIRNKSNFIFDLRRNDKFDQPTINEIIKIFNYLSLKPPKTLIILGEIEVPETISKAISNLSQKHGIKLIYTVNLKKLKSTLQKEQNCKLILDLIINKKIVEVEDIHYNSKPSNTQSNVYMDFCSNKKIELVFNSDTNPYSRDARVYHCNNEKKRILTTQTKPPTKINSSQKILLTTLSRNNAGAIIRIAYNCRILKVIKEHKIGDSIIQNALLLDFYPPKKEVNLRTSYRYQLNSHYKVESTITLLGEKFFSDLHFEIDDISVTGLGIKISDGNCENNGLNASVGDNAKIEINLVEPTKKNMNPKRTKLESFIEIVRKSPLGEDKKHVGMRFCDIDKKYELSINRFINCAQSYELRKKHRTF